VADLRWWRLELDAKGAVVSCIPCERVEKDGERWIYVQAIDQARAGRAAWNVFCRDRERAQRAARVAAGKCVVCGKNPNRGSDKRCTECLERARLDDKRRRDKRAGRPVDPPRDRRTVLAERKEREHHAVVVNATPVIRLDVLLDVQSAWEDAANNGAFTTWLKRQIEAAGGVRRVG
jgi:hypothetical protein